MTDYNGGRDLKDLVEYVNTEAGTQRSPSGGLLPTAGESFSLCYSDEWRPAAHRR